MFLASRNGSQPSPTTGHTITLDHLLTHTSALRDLTRLRMLTEEDRENAALMATPP
jgi:CubicO group peptidase (beta-lactamase class C family)